MLRKLMKHEFRATGRVMGPLYVVLLATAVGANVSARLMDRSSSTLLNVAGAFVVIAFVVALIGVSIMSIILMVNRFRTNLMGDEGYVMFTLPVSVHQLIWSKILVSTVWFVATGAVVMLSFFVVGYEVGMVRLIVDWFARFMAELTAYYALNGAAIMAEAAVLVVVGCAALCLQFYAALATGHSFASHKMLLSVEFFFAYYFGMQFLATMALVGLAQFSLPFSLSGMAAVHFAMGLSVIGVAIYGAVFYVITAVMLQRRLNLE